MVLVSPEPDTAPAEHATYHRTFDHIINQISDRHDQQQQAHRPCDGFKIFTTRLSDTNGRFAKASRKALSAETIVARTGVG